MQILFFRSYPRILCEVEGLVRLGSQAIDCSAVLLNRLTRRRRYCSRNFLFFDDLWRNGVLKKGGESSERSLGAIWGMEIPSIDQQVREHTQFSSWLLVGSWGICHRHWNWKVVRKTRRSSWRTSLTTMDYLQHRDTHFTDFAWRRYFMDPVRDIFVQRIERNWEKNNSINNCLLFALLWELILQFSRKIGFGLMDALDYFFDYFDEAMHDECSHACYTFIINLC